MLQSIRDGSGEGFDYYLYWGGEGEDDGSLGVSVAGGWL